MQQFPTIRLAIPTRVAAPFDHPDWIFELKMTVFGLSPTSLMAAAA
jgi:hypothetical protein